MCLHSKSVRCTSVVVVVVVFVVEVTVVCEVDVTVVVVVDVAVVCVVVVTVVCEVVVTVVIVVVEVSVVCVVDDTVVCEVVVTVVVVVLVAVVCVVVVRDVCEVVVTVVIVVVDVAVVCVVVVPVVCVVVVTDVIVVVVVGVAGSSVVFVVGVVSPLHSTNAPSLYAAIIALNEAETSKHVPAEAVMAAPTHWSEYATSPGPRNSLTVSSSAAATSLHTEKSMRPLFTLCATSTELAPSWLSHATNPENGVAKQVPITSLSMLACASQPVAP